MEIIEIFLIVVLCLCFCIVIGLAIYILAYYAHPDDNTKEFIWFYRLVFVWSFSFAMFLYMLFPVDILAAPRDDSLGWEIPIKAFWAISITISAIN